MGAMIKPGGAIGTTGVLSGQVIDGDTQKPLAGVFVTAKSSNETYKAKTDKRGFFAIAGVEVGSYDVTLDKDGYTETITQAVQVTGDATTNLTFSMSTTPVAVSGTTVYSKRAILNPRQVMTNYGYSDQDIQHVAPPIGPNLSITNLYETLPGVQVGYDVYYGANQPHIRGGTGSDVNYAFDGIPTYETISNTFGTNLTYIGTKRTDFYVGAYPAQYGNFLSGFVNQVAKTGSGPMHANLEYQMGTWLDNGAKLPSYNPTTGLSPTYNGQPAYSPTDINFSLEGKDRRFSYFLQQVVQDDGLVPYPYGADIKPFTVENGGFINQQQLRDTLVNLHYDLTDQDNLQLMMLEGIGKFGFAGYQELPCLSGSTNCFSSNTAAGFGNTYNANVFANSPDSQEISSYDLEKFEWSHHFSPGNVFNLRTWRYNPSVYFNNFAAPSTFWEFRRAQSSGLLGEYQTQITDQHLLDAGASYDYSNNFLYSAANNIGAPAAASPFFFASGTSLLYNTNNSPGTLGNVNGTAGTQTDAAWISDEWRPTPKWDVQAGLRYDKQYYMILPGVNGTPFSLGLPGYLNGITQDPGYTQPGYVTPRLGASYKLSDKLTMKASFGRFVTFAPARRVEIVTGAQDSTSTADGQGKSTFASGFTPPTGTVTLANGASGCTDAKGCYQFPAGTAEWLPGALPQMGESLDVSWEYQLNDTTYAKLTPYIKHINNPLTSTTVNNVSTFTNAGQIQSQGVEFLLKSQDWHNLSGWISYTYSHTTGSQLPFEGVMESGAGALQDQNQVVPVPYDQRHFLTVNLNYKAGKRWEISPDFTYGSGYPYGIGSSNLNALALLTGAAYTNPLNETTFDGLRHPGWWLANLHVTYHASDGMDAVLSVFNLFNSTQILNTDNSVLHSCGYVETAGCGYTSNDGTANILPQYNPLAGQYAPIGYPSLRQFWLTFRFKLD